MANRLNVLVGAELASNVTRELNKEIEKLKLEDTEVGLKIKSGSAKKLENEVAETLADVLSHKKIYKKMPPGLGADIGDIIANGIKKSFGTEIGDELDKQIKKIVKNASEDAKKYSKAFLEKNEYYSEKASYFRDNKRDKNQERDWIKISREAQKIQKKSKEAAAASKEWKNFNRQINSHISEVRRLDDEYEKLTDSINETTDAAEKNRLSKQAEDVALESSFHYKQAQDIEKKRNSLLLSDFDAYDIAYKNINNIDDSLVDNFKKQAFDEAFDNFDTRKIIETQKVVNNLTGELEKLESELDSLGVEDNKTVAISKKIDAVKNELSLAKNKLYEEISSYEKMFKFGIFDETERSSYISESLKTNTPNFKNSEIEKAQKRLETSNELLETYREHIQAINNQSDEDIFKKADELANFYYENNKSELYRKYPNDQEARENVLNEIRQRYALRLKEEQEQKKKYYDYLLAQEEKYNENYKRELEKLKKDSGKQVVDDADSKIKKELDASKEALKSQTDNAKDIKDTIEEKIESKKQELDVTEDLAKKTVESEDKIQEASKETADQQKKDAEQEAAAAQEAAKKIIKVEKEKQDEIEKTTDEYKDAVKTFKSVYGDDGSLKQETTKYDFKDGITETVDTFYRTKKDGSISKKQLVTVSDKTQELAYQDAHKANKELEKSVGLASEFEEKISGLYNKEFVDVDQLIRFENAFDEIIDDIEKYQDNADGLINVQERLNKLIKETGVAESAANSKANEQASAEKTERAKELRNSISAYNTLRKTVDDLYEYAGNFHIFDEEDAKRIISFENDLEDLYNIIKKDTASIEDLALAQKLLNEMQSKADSHESSLKNRSNQYDKETRERIAAENKLQKKYDETKKKAEDARKVVASSLENAKNILGGNAIHNDELTKLQEELIQIGNILDKDDAKVEELEDALRRLNNIRLNIDTRLGFEEKLNRELEKIESNLDVKSTKLRSRFGDLFDENELRSYWNFTKNINEELRKEKPNWVNISRLIEQAKQKTSKFEAKLAASAKVFDSSLDRFVQFYGFGELFRGLKTAFTNMFEQIKLVDAGMVELRKVTNETEYAYDKFLTNSAEKAKELGVTISDYINSVTEFARMGYSFAESQEIAKTANIMQMVSENLTADEASEYLISTMAGFNIEAEESMRIVDALNNVSNNFAVTTDG